MCYNTNVKGGKSVFDHGAFLVNGVSDSGFTALFDTNVSIEMFFIDNYYTKTIRIKRKRNTENETYYHSPTHPIYPSYQWNGGLMD